MGKLAEKFRKKISILARSDEFSFFKKKFNSSDRAEIKKNFRFFSASFPIFDFDLPTGGHRDLHYQSKWANFHFYLTRLLPPIS